MIASEHLALEEGTIATGSDRINETSDYNYY